MKRRQRSHITLMVLAALSAAPCGWAQQAAPMSLDPELLTRCEIEIRRMKARGQKEFAAELQKQLDLYVKDPVVHAAVHQETTERITQARAAFNQYYDQLVAEGQTEGAERMRQLFEISLTGAPVATGAEVERAGPTPSAE